MTTEEIKLLLINHAANKCSHVESIGRGMYCSGFDDCLELMLPLLYTVDKINSVTKKEFDEAPEFWSSRINNEVYHTLQDLAQKLKG